MYILTGGAGFIGSVFLDFLNQKGIDDILVVDNLTPEKEKNLAGKKFREYLHKREFLSRVTANKLPDGITAIIHLGACTSTTETNAQYMMENNYVYSLTLTQYALEREIRYIYASSAATYGDGELGFSDDDELTFQLQPLNVYAESKLKFDQWAIRTGAAKQSAGLRFFNVYGPNEYHKGDMMSVVLKSYRQIQDSGHVKLFKSYKPEYRDGEQQRDFVYVRDCAEVMWWLLENPNTIGIFNVGSGQARTWKDLVTAVFQACGKKLNIEYVDMPETLKPKYQYRTQAELKKLRGSGFNRPFTTLEDGVNEYVRTLQANVSR